MRLPVGKTTSGQSKPTNIRMTTPSPGDEEAKPFWIPCSVSQKTFLLPNIKLTNVYIWGGARTSEGQTVLRRRRLKMTAEALQKLFRWHGNEIVEDAEAEDTD